MEDDKEKSEKERKERIQRQLRRLQPPSREAIRRHVERKKLRALLDQDEIDKETDTLYAKVKADVEKMKRDAGV